MKSTSSKSTSKHSNGKSANGKKLIKVVQKPRAGVRKPSKVQEKKTAVSQVQEYAQKYASRNLIMFLIAIAIVLLCTCCTYSITMVSTDGHASDVVDETTNNDPNIAPTLQIPVKL